MTCPSNGTRLGFRRLAGSHLGRHGCFSERTRLSLARPEWQTGRFERGMKLPQDSRIICAGLDQFCLPSALFERSSDRFVGWNKSFIEATEISADEMRVVPVSEILRMETPTAETSECETAPGPVHPEKCILKATSDGECITAKLFEREDGYSLVILDGTTAEQSNEDFIRGLITGKTEEQDRIRQKFHDDVAPQIMAAAFATETLAERVRHGADQDPEELKRIADLISDLVGGIRVALGTQPASPQDRQAS